MAEALPRGADHEVVAVAHEVLARVGLRLRPKVVVVRDDAVVDVGRVEEVADARERLDRLVGDPVQDIGCIAEALGELAAHLEVVGAVRVLRHVPVHVLDLGLQLRGVHALFCRHLSS